MTSSQSREVHQFQFRDQVIPPRVCHLLKEKKISRNDLLILFVVGSLVRHQGSEDGVGCYASNSYIGDAVGATPNYVSSRLHEMEKMGIMLVVWVEDRRYLELEWSRTAEEREALAGKYGKAHRKAYKALVNRILSDEGVTKNRKGGNESSLPPHNEKSLPKYNVKSEEGSCRPQADRKPSSFVPLNGESKTDQGILAKQLYEGLQKQNKIMRPPDLKSWAKDFLVLLDQRSFDQIQEAIGLHLENLDHKFWPQFYSAKSFCEGFARLESAMRRMEKEEEPKVW